MDTGERDLKVKELAALYREAVTKDDAMLIKSAEAAMSHHAEARASALKSALASSFVAEAMKVQR